MRALLVKLTAALVLVAALAAGGLWMDYRAFAERPLTVPEVGASYEVRPGMALRHVAQALHAQGVLNRPHYFVWLARWKGLAARIQAGEYLIAPGTTPQALLEQMAAGRVRLYGLTIVEGWNFKQVLEAIRQNPYLQPTLDGLTAEEIMARLGQAGEHPEGRFLPDTYRFPRGTADLDFLRRANEALEAFLAEQWESRAVGLPLNSPYEALILASIIEKETGVPSEREAVSGVFVRRLHLGMRLQTDPTVIYGLGEAFDGNLRRKHLLEDGPYNTYRRHGMPPTPIAMPGRAAIRAALHPGDGDALYFVSRGDGSHHFSATLEEHNQAVVKYQLKGRVRAVSTVEEAAPAEAPAAAE